MLQRKLLFPTLSISWFFIFLSFQLPRNPVSQLINVLEVDDPKLAIVFHMIAPLESLTPHLDSPLSNPMVLLRKLAKEDMDRAKELHISEGFMLKNLEPNCKLGTHFSFNWHEASMDNDNKQLLEKNIFVYIKKLRYQVVRKRWQNLTQLNDLPHFFVLIAEYEVYLYLFLTFKSDERSTYGWK